MPDNDKPKGLSNVREVLPDDDVHNEDIEISEEEDKILDRLYEEHFAKPFIRDYSTEE